MHAKIIKTTFKSIAIVLTIFSTGLFFTGCSKDNSAPKPKNIAPTITSIDVNSGPYNTSITITGTGFDQTTTNNKIFFNGKAAAVSKYGTTTQLYTKVPLGAGTGSITVTLNGITATGPVFTYQPSEVVTPFAGSGFNGSANGDGATATFFGTYSLALDVAGNLYVADGGNNMIRKITPEGLVSTFAGSGTKGSADGVSTQASFNNPTGVTVDAAGNVYVVDQGNNLIRKITSSGLVSTLAGSGTKGFADGAGAAASFNRPTDLVADRSGNLYVTDTYNLRIRKITPLGFVTTFAGNSSPYSSDGIGTAASFSNPNGITIDKAGNLYVSQGDNLIRKITPDGIVTSVAGTSVSPLTSSFFMPQGLAVDGSENLFMTNAYQIEELSTNGQLTNFAGNGVQNSVNGVIANASFNFLQGIAIDGKGNIYVSEGNDIKKIFFQ